MPASGAVPSVNASNGKLPHSTTHHNNSPPSFHGQKCYNRTAPIVRSVSSKSNRRSSSSQQTQQHLTNTRFQGSLSNPRPSPSPTRPITPRYPRIVSSILSLSTTNFRPWQQLCSFPWPQIRRGCRGRHFRGTIRLVRPCHMTSCNDLHTMTQRLLNNPATAIRDTGVLSLVQQVGNTEPREPNKSPTVVGSESTPSKSIAGKVQDRTRARLRLPKRTGRPFDAS